MDIELDEGALYGEEELGPSRGSLDLAAGRHSEEAKGARGSLDDSDEDVSTDVDVGLGSRGSVGTASLEGAFPSIPEDEPVGSRMASASGAIDMINRLPPTDLSDLSKPIGGVKMGSSAPISIPGMRIPKPTPVQPVEEKVVSATFVPPHMIGSMGAFGFSMEGASPAAVLKKDKLRARNQILASTGYLAQEDFAAAQISTMAGSLTTGMAGSERRFSQSPILAAGGLKAAMQAQQ